MRDLIPVSVIITTLNEAPRIKKCIDALDGFGEVIVVDSGSRDGTANIAAENGVKVIDFAWNGAYPKKRGWCLENIETVYDWIFFVDADEIVTGEIKKEIAALFKAVPKEAGFFVGAQYIVDGAICRYGLKNKKLCLIDRTKMIFPIVDDLDCPGMGEIEGHYQPVLKEGFESAPIGKLGSKMLHHAYGGAQQWRARHEKYAAWEICMSRKNAWPQDPVKWRQFLKQIFRKMPLRGAAAFAHSYILKLGVLDGRAGFILARDRFRYYRMIASGHKGRGRQSASATLPPDAPL